jgi:hypothetical protein
MVSMQSIDFRSRQQLCHLVVRLRGLSGCNHCVPIHAVVPHVDGRGTPYRATFVWQQPAHRVSGEIRWRTSHLAIDVILEPKVCMVKC